MHLRLLILGGLVASGGGCSDDCDPEATLQDYLHGDEVDCGAVTFGSTNAEVLDARACMVEQLEANRPFVVRWLAAIVIADEPHAYAGLLVGEEGTLDLVKMSSAIDDNGIRVTMSRCAALVDMGGCQTPEEATDTTSFCFTCEDEQVIHSCEEDTRPFPPW